MTAVGDKKHRRIEFVNAETDERFYYEQFMDDDGTVVATEGDSRLENIMNLLVVRQDQMTEEEALTDPEVARAIGQAIYEITGHEGAVDYDKMRFSRTSRGGWSVGHAPIGRTSTAGWKKKVLH